MGRLSYLPSRLQSVPQRKAIASDSWRAGKDTTSARGYGYRWQCYRLQFLERNPLCVKCKARGFVTTATVVDHVVPHKGDERLFWDEGNHQALCKPCHDSDKAREERAEGHR